MRPNEKTINYMDDLQRILDSRNKESLVVLATELKILRARTFKKDELIREILKLPDAEVRRALNMDWWQLYHNHVYGIASIIGLLLAWLFYEKGPSQQKQDQILDKIGEIKANVAEEKRINEPSLNERFKLGYRLFGIAENTYIPLQDPITNGIHVHWNPEHDSYSSDGATLTLNLPDIDLSPNMLLRGVSVQIPNKVGARMAFHLDPTVFKRGAAIANNTWVQSDIKTDNITSENKSPFPADARLTHITRATIIWGNSSTYTLGEMKTNGQEFMIDGGTLRIGQPSIFEHIELFRGNKINGGPRGGYRFPMANVIIGNIFNETTIDARSLKDGVIVANNRFVSSLGAFTLGTEPEFSFIIEIIRTETYGAVMVFGLHPYIP